MPAKTVRELTPRALNRVMGLAAGERFVVGARLPLLRPDLRPDEYLSRHESDSPTVWRLAVASLGLLALLACRPPNAPSDGVMWLVTSVAAVIVVVCSWAMLLRRPATLTISAEGIQIQSGRRREMVGWTEVDAAQARGIAGLIVTQRQWILIDLRAAGADRLYNAATRVISAREHGEMVRLADWTPEAALSLTDAYAADQPDQRAISLTPSDDD